MSGLFQRLAQLSHAQATMQAPAPTAAAEVSPSPLSPPASSATPSSSVPAPVVAGSSHLKRRLHELLDAAATQAGVLFKLPFASKLVGMMVDMIDRADETTLHVAFSGLILQLQSAMDQDQADAEAKLHELAQQASAHAALIHESERTETTPTDDSIGNA